MQQAEAPIELVAHDPAWADRFAEERRLLAVALAPWLRGEIEHIGSTAVPGLVAKPVLDLMAPVASLAASVDAIAAAEAAGYRYFPYKPDAMHWFCKPSPEFRTHHLHLVPHASALWRERLFFRDALRRSASLRREYADLKLALAVRFRHDREAYTDGKTAFVLRVLAEMVAAGPG